MYPSSNPLQLLRQGWRDACRWAQRSWKTTGIFLGLTIALVYLTIAFIPLPEPISSATDAAWQYRLSQLDQNDAIFGRDAVSFYGSLGYWLRGVVLGDNFDTVLVVRLSIHLLLIVVALLKLLRLNDLVTRLTLAVSFLFPYTIAELYPALQTESQLSFIWLLLLSLDEIWGASGRYWAIGLGAAAGVLINASGAIGTVAIVSLLLFLGVRSGQRWIAAPQFETALAIVLELLETILAFGTLAFLCLAPGDSDPLWRLLLVIGIAATIGYALLPRVLRRLIGIYPQLSQLSAMIHRLDRHAPQVLNPLGELGAGLVFGLGLLYLTGFTEPSLAAYLKGYSELSASYGSAMSPAPSEAIVGFGGYLQGYIAAFTHQLDRLPTGMEYGGSPLEFRLIGLEILGLIAAIVIAVPLGNPAVAIAIFPFLFHWIDQSLVGQGDEVLIFIFSLPFVLAIVISTWRSPLLRRLGSIAHGLTLVFCLWSYAYYVQVTDYPTDHLRVFAPDRVRMKATALLNPQRLHDDLERNSQANLAALKFPEDLRQAIGDRSVDVLPDATTIIGANNLNWQPLPVIPTHLAYTQYLDGLNRDALRREPRDLLLYRFAHRDDRHPFFDTPATSFQIWCTYEIAPDLPTPLLPEADLTSPLNNLLALTPRDRDRCSPPTSERTISVSWNQKIPIHTDQDTIVHAAIQVHYSLWGTLMKRLFRIPPVQLTLWNSADEAITYRILPDNAASGLLISPLPRTQGEIQAWFQGEFPDRLYGFELSTHNLKLFAPTSRVTLQTYTPRDVVDRPLSSPL